MGRSVLRPYRHMQALLFVEKDEPAWGGGREKKE
jgi:hypothetical protein